MLNLEIMKTIKTMLIDIVFIIIIIYRYKVKDKKSNIPVTIIGLGKCETDMIYHILNKS